MTSTMRSPPRSDPAQRLIHFTRAVIPIAAQQRRIAFHLSSTKGVSISRSAIAVFANARQPLVSRSSQYAVPERLIGAQRCARLQCAKINAAAFMHHPTVIQHQNLTIFIQHRLPQLGGQSRRRPKRLFLPLAQPHRRNARNSPVCKRRSGLNPPAINPHFAFADNAIIRTWARLSVRAIKNYPAVVQRNWR